MASIVKARGAEMTPVYVPVYDAPIDAPYSEIANYPICNRENKVITDSILCELDDPTRLKDINGWKVTMVTKVNGHEYRDTVEIYGEKNRVYNVKIKDEIYSVQKSIVRFINKVKPIE